MPPVYETLLLNTAVPQIQAAQAGDSYVMVVNATTPALRITQTGTGDSILVEDAANPDSSPFVVTATGSVGIGLSSPEGKLHVANTGTAGTTADNLAVYFTSTNRNANLYIRAKNTEGSVLNFADGDSDVVGRIAYEHSDNSMRFDVSGGEKMRLDASGNLGLGVTPSAWSSSVATQVGYGAALSSRAAGNTASDVTHGAYWNGTNWLYQHGSVGATRYQMTGANAGSTHAWFVSAGGTAGDAISFTQAMTLDASGNLLVGNTSGNVGSYGKAISLAATASPYAGLEISGTTGGALEFQTSQSTRQVQLLGNSSGFIVNVNGGSGLAERARIDSSGNMRIGTTSHLLASNRRLTVFGQAGIEAVATGTTNEPCVEMWQQATSGDNVFTSFYTEASFTARGSITYNRAGGLVAYNTTSDYRAKDILGPFADSGTTIDALKVYNGKMKGATVERPMLIAHEAQEVTPYAVTGDKDAVNDDGTPKYQQMDVSSLVPLLIAEIQSLRARVAQLEQGA